MTCCAPTLPSRAAPDSDDEPPDGGAPAPRPLPAFRRTPPPASSAPWRSPISLDPRRARGGTRAPGQPGRGPGLVRRRAPGAAGGHRRSRSRQDRDVHAWQLPWALAVFLDRRGHWNDYATTPAHRARGGPAAGRPQMARRRPTSDLGHAYVALGRYDLAHGHLIRALDLYGELDDRAGEARTHLDHLRPCSPAQDRYREAIDQRPGRACGCSGPPGTTTAWPGP